MTAPELDASEAVWWVRHAGRQSGPFDLARLRVMASRGALTRFHQVSADGHAWLPAIEVRVLFNQDGTVVAHASATRAPAGYDAGLAAELEAAWDSAGADHEGEAPRPGDMRAPGAPHAGRVTVRAAQGVAVACAILALAAPTSRTPGGDLQWWVQQEPLSVAVHALCAIAIAAWWVAMALPPTPALGSALGATSGLLAAAAALPLKDWAPWAVPLAAGTPCAAALAAFIDRRAGGVHALGLGVAAVSAASVVGAGLLLWLSFAAWGVVSLVLGCVGAVALAFAGVHAVHAAMDAGAHRKVFAALVVAGVGYAGALFAAACAGLASAEPIHGAAGAVAALLMLALSVLAWSGAYQALALAARTARSLVGSAEEAS